MTLEYPEWLRLLALASRYGGLPGEGLYHYYEEEGAVIPEETAGDMAEAERDLQASVRAGRRNRGPRMGPSRPTRRRCSRNPRRGRWRTPRASGGR
jgi:hypothetical protein